jgi:minor curlin subunit
MPQLLGSVSPFFGVATSGGDQPIFDRANSMTNLRSKLLPLAVAAILATLYGPVSAELNMNTTIQEGRVNTNDTRQRGSANDNATWQDGWDNANRTRQRGPENWNATAQFGRINYNETDQKHRSRRSGPKRHGRAED